MGLKGNVFTTAVDTINTTVSTILQITSVNVAVKIRGFWICTKGTSSSAKSVTVTLDRQVGATTGTAIAALQKLNDSIADSFNLTAKEIITSEPVTSSTPLRRWTVPAFASVYDYSAPIGDEIIIGVGDMLGMRAVLESGEANLEVEAGFLVEE